METAAQLVLFWLIILGLIAVGIGLFVCVGLADVFQLQSCHWLLGVVLWVLKGVLGLIGR